MTKKELYAQVAERFEKAMPDAATELHYSNPFELLVAVILSAQCTDKRVNMITPALLHDYPTAEAMALATDEVIFEYIQSVTYPRNKAKHLVGMAQMLQRDFGGKVPDTMEELTRLPGVGRKTANVILSVVFQESAMAVDTHVFRVSHRIGLVPDSASTPLAVEKQLTRFFPSDIIPKAHHWLILHGRYVCQARKPKCHECCLLDICKKATKDL
ncbi:MAG: endonuclease III [Bacteroidaceae bacterium]|nr:endonuclease III [Bacteroidaceae bacterium]